MDRVRIEIGCNDRIQKRYTGKGIGVAILDTGVAYHKDIEKNVIKFHDFINNKKEPYDDNGHGTHIAGIIAGNGVSSNGIYKGIATDAKLICLKVLNEFGDGNTSEVLKAIDYVIENKKRYNIRLMNVSIGTIPKSNNGERTRLIQGVERAWDEGICVVVAAGNNGPEPMSVTTPGISRKVITVGSSDEGQWGEYKNRFTRYTGRGPTPFCIVKPEVVAPGFSVTSCSKENSGYIKKSGSSMSTAVVTGSIALLIERNPYITNSEIKLRLYERCIDMGLPKNQQGWGLIHIDSLLR